MRWKQNQGGNKRRKVEATNATNEEMEEDAMQIEEVIFMTEDHPNMRMSTSQCNTNNVHVTNSSDFNDKYVILYDW